MRGRRTPPGQSDGDTPIEEQRQTELSTGSTATPDGGNGTGGEPTTTNPGLPLDQRTREDRRNEWGHPRPLHPQVPAESGPDCTPAGGAKEPPGERGAGATHHHRKRAVQAVQKRQSEQSDPKQNDTRGPRAARNSNYEAASREEDEEVEGGVHDVVAVCTQMLSYCRMAPVCPRENSLTAWSRARVRVTSSCRPSERWCRQ